MAIDLDGIIFGQIFGDNSSDNDPTSNTEFDSDGDGTTTQEDEFVSITNTTGAPMDISGWQIWSDASGTNAPDPEQDGLYHTFPLGSVLEPGETLWIINEITGAEPDWAQEASEGGVESGPGGENTNFLSEGNIKPKPEAVALVNPDTGEYIVFNMAPNPPEIQNLPGFPGTEVVGIVDGHSVQADMAAGFSYQYDEATDSYIYAEAFVPCFAAGTLVATPDGPR
ncbi:MAG: lamin tail domain-containing protein, partial [Pseudomonadota bacterium]